MLTLRYMTLADIPQVVNIDRHSFGMPWSARSYAYEIAESSYSHMVVLEYTPETPALPAWRRWLQSLNGGHQHKRRIVAYGGLWRVMQEAHISTIASHPNWRGRGYGEIMLAAMICKALELKASYVVLEVRITNEVAQNLYRKYAFNTVAVKPRYYRDNGEDAYDMRVMFDSQNRVEYHRRFTALKVKFGFENAYVNHTPPPQGAN
jgi:[ribosomal protein S18]-alanine N-acetyltransferase